MRVLLVTQDFPPERGGIQTYCHELARHLHAQGHAVRVVCPDPPGAAEIDAALPFPVTRVRIKNSLLWAWVLRHLDRVVGEFRPDAILYAQWQSGVWNLLPGERASRAVAQATLVHGRELFLSVFRGLTRPFAARVLRRMDVAIPNSRAVRDLLKPLRPSGETSIVHPGVDAWRFSRGNHDAVKSRLGWSGCQVVGLIARLVPRKNVAALLRAAAALRERHPGLRVLVGGEGPDGDRLRALCGELRLGDICHFAGPVAAGELADHYAALDVLVMPAVSTPTDLEGFGIVYLEAGALGVPSLAYRSGGVADAIKDRRSGILVTQGDETALQAALSDLLANEPRRRRLGIEARARASALDWSANARAIADILARCAAAKSPTRGPPDPAARTTSP